MHSAATRTMASTVIRTCTFTCRREVTKRMTPTTLPFTVKGWDTARICSPVLGSAPRK